MKALSTVVSEINRYSRQEVRLAHPELGNLRVSGSFRAGSVENFVSAVTTLYPLSVSPDSEADSVVLLDWRS